jgi:guanylate kinase
MIILVGASASGKTEIAKTLMREHGIKKAVTTTTRLPRAGERDGIDYFFVTKDEFLRRKAADSFVETTLYNGNLYGTGKSEIDNRKCLVVDPNGLRSFLALHDPTVVTFLLTATEKTRESRMRTRGDKEEDIKRRLDNDRKDFDLASMPKTDFVIATDEKTVEELTTEVLNDYKRVLLERGIDF